MICFNHTCWLWTWVPWVCIAAPCWQWLSSCGCGPGEGRASWDTGAGALKSNPAASTRPAPADCRWRAWSHRRYRRSRLGRPCPRRRRPPTLVWKEERWKMLMRRRVRLEKATWGEKRVSSYCEEERIYYVFYSCPWGHLTQVMQKWQASQEQEELGIQHVSWHLSRSKYNDMFSKNDVSSPKEIQFHLRQGKCRQHSSPKTKNIVLVRIYAYSTYMAMCLRRLLIWEEQLDLTKFSNLLISLFPFLCGQYCALSYPYFTGNLHWERLTGLSIKSHRIKRKKKKLKFAEYQTQSARS